MKEFLGLPILAALEAGKKILEVYTQDFSVKTKADNSPLTVADTLAHKIIKGHLKSTSFPVLSEEGKMVLFEERELWAIFWLVDPLDGTKEFVNKNGEFTVNIALIKNGVPVLGVVYAPVTGKLYYGAENIGSFCFNITHNLTMENIEQLLSGSQKMPFVKNPAKYVIVASRSHCSQETQAFIESKRAMHENVELISAGSSIKLCLVAEGSANVYPRLAPTMEWDTAAGHAVAKYAGCRVYNFDTNNELVYNKKDLLNPWFVVERL